MNNRFNKTMSWLDTISVRFRPKSNEVYERVLSFSKDFESLSFDEKERLVSEVTDSMSKKLLAFSGFFAEIAMTTGESRWIQGAIVLHFIENFRLDYRENFRYLALIDYACSMIGLSLEDVFPSISEIALPIVKKRINDYISSPRDPNDIESVGVQVVSSEGGFRFVPMKQ